MKVGESFKANGINYLVVQSKVSGEYMIVDITHAAIIDHKNTLQGIQNYVDAYIWED